MTRWLRWAWPLVIVGTWAGLSLAGIDPRDALVRPVATLEGSLLVAAGILAAYLVRAVVLLPATLLTLLSGFTLGVAWGSLVAIVGSTASALVAYGLARGSGPARGVDATQPVRRERRLLARLADRLRDEPFTTTLIARLALLPGDVINLAAGASRVPWVAFAMATALGGLPGLLAAVLAGASLDAAADAGAVAIDPRALIASLVLAGATAVLAVALRRRTAANGES